MLNALVRTKRDAVDNEVAAREAEISRLYQPLLHMQNEELVVMQNLINNLAKQLVRFDRVHGSIIHLNAVQRTEIEKLKEKVGHLKSSDI